MEDPEQRYSTLNRAPGTFKASGWKGMTRSQGHPIIVCCMQSPMELLVAGYESAGQDSNAHFVVPGSGHGPAAL